MARWLIVKSGAITPPSGSAFDAAYMVQLARGSWTREVVVEFAAPSSVVSVAYAEEVTRPFLADQEPPQHLTVDVGGQIHVLTEARPASDEPSDSRIVREPQRARNHHRH